jgi:hypothetical protein
MSVAPPGRAAAIMPFTGTSRSPDEAARTVAHAPRSRANPPDTLWVGNGGRSAGDPPHSSLRKEMHGLAAGTLPLAAMVAL